MLHKIKAIDYIQVCTERLAAVAAKQHNGEKEPVIQGLFDDTYTLAIK